MTDQPIHLEGPEIIDQEARTTAVVSGTVPMAELRDFYDRAFTQVSEVLQEQGVTPGEAFGYYIKTVPESVQLEAGFVTDRAISPAGDVVPSELPGGQMAHAVHVGAYDSLPAAYGQLVAWLVEQGREPGPSMWEVYVTEPTPDADPASMRTDLFWPLV